jgi:putative membrane protein
MTRRITTVPVILALFIAMSQGYAYGQAAGGYNDPHMWGYGGGWGWMILGPIMMIGVIAAIVAVVVLIVRWLGGAPQSPHLTHPSPPGKAPLDILKERFARGDIDKEEFEERKRLLSD